ncbi:unnamed protein product [Citrullus colocynthis]|uniref:Major facilitator superfamily (MFS) profile domain-containing protein n=1 Tax=Citrullus colocynthis TaxID=252529 RepID=A0ABP0Z330_9ROSI
MDKETKDDERDYNVGAPVAQVLAVVVIATPAMLIITEMTPIPLMDLQKHASITSLNNPEVENDLVVLATLVFHFSFHIFQIVFLSYPFSLALALAISPSPLSSRYTSIGIGISISRTFVGRFPMGSSAIGVGA